LLSISDLFGYVARRVPMLTAGLQHPYHKIEGTDLAYVAVEGAVALADEPTPPPGADNATPVDVKADPSNTIGVLQFTNLRGEERDEWIGKALRVAFNTELSKVGALRVYSPEVIDQTAQARRADSLTTAQHLGLSKLVAGAYQVVGSNLRIDAHILDVPTGVQQGSDSVQGDVNGFFDLQKQLVLSMLRRLPVPFSTEEGESIQRETNTDVNAYRLLLEAEGVVDDPRAGDQPAIKRAQKPTAEPQSYFKRPRVPSAMARALAVLVDALMPATAWAEDEQVEAAVRALVEA
jgi:TolB-like protein